MTCKTAREACEWDIKILREKPIVMFTSEEVAVMLEELLEYFRG